MKRIIAAILMLFLTFLFSCSSDESPDSGTKDSSESTITQNDSLMYKFNFLNAKQYEDTAYLPEIFSTNDGSLIIAETGYHNCIYKYDKTTDSLSDLVSYEDETYEFRFRRFTSTQDGNYIGLGNVTDKAKYEELLETSAVIEQHDGYTIKRIPQELLRESGAKFDALMFFGKDGKLTGFSKDVDIPDLMVFSHTTRYDRLLCDNNGNIYFYYNNTLEDGESDHIFVWDKTGKFLFILSKPDDLEFKTVHDTLMLTADGTTVFQYAKSKDLNQTYAVYRTIDIDNKCFGDVINIPDIVYAIAKSATSSVNVPIFGLGHDIYYYDDTGLYYQNNNSDPVLMFSWITIGLSVDLIRNVIIISPEEIYVQITDPDTGNDAFGKISLVPVSSVYGEDVETPPTLRLAIDQENNPYSARMLKYASSFVRSEKGCQVEIVSYSDTEGGLSANQKLARDISAGDQPDLVVFGGGLSYETLAKQDVFADIYGFIDADPDYDRSDFLGCVLSPFESSDGTLKRLVSEFAIQTMISGKNTVGELGSMTLDDFARFGSSLSDGQYLVSTISFDGKDLPERLLNNTLSVMLDEFVDFENGKCDFDGIRTLLDICTNSKILAVPGFTDPKSLAEKKLLFAPVYYFDLGYFMLDRYMSFPDGDIQYTGYPTTTGNQKNSAVSPVISTSIMKTSASQNTSWELMKYFISMKELEAEKVTEARDVADLMNFPCTKKGIEGMITVARSYRFGMSAGEIENDDGSISSVISVNAYDLPEEESERVKKNSNLGLEVYFTDEDEKALWSLLDSAGRIYTKGSSVLPIITEEASSCFAGVKSIDDVVGLIQNRVNILINE